MLEGFPACRIAFDFDSMSEAACEAAKVAYKEKIGDLQSVPVEDEKPGSDHAGVGGWRFRLVERQGAATYF